jgi:peroxiredoxin
MAQLRQDYQEFVKRGVEVLIIGPDGPNAYKRYWAQEQMPFTGLADIGNKIADKYHQEVNLLKAGRMPAMFIVDKEGVIRYSHYGNAMWDIPENREILARIDNLLKVDEELGNKAIGD